MGINPQISKTKNINNVQAITQLEVKLKDENLTKNKKKTLKKKLKKQK